MPLNAEQSKVSEDVHDKVYAELAYHQDVDPGDDLAAFALHDLADRVIALCAEHTLAVLEAIVRDLAATPRHDETNAGDLVCSLCGDPWDDHIDPACEWRRAVEWVAEHPPQRDRAGTDEGARE